MAKRFHWSIPLFTSLFGNSLSIFGNILITIFGKKVLVVRFFLMTSYFHIWKCFFWLTSYFWYLLTSPFSLPSWLPGSYLAFYWLFSCFFMFSVLYSKHVFTSLSHSSFDIGFLNRYVLWFAFYFI